MCALGGYTGTCVYLGMRVSVYEHAYVRTQGAMCGHLISETSQKQIFQRLPGLGPSPQLMVPTG